MQIPDSVYNSQIPRGLNWANFLVNSSTGPNFCISDKKNNFFFVFFFPPMNKTAQFIIFKKKNIASNLELESKIIQFYFIFSSDPNNFEIKIKKFVNIFFTSFDLNILREKKRKPSI